MTGFCKCDICGNVYHKDENKNYDGLMVWHYDEDGDIACGNRKYNIVTPNGESMKDIPEMMDVCHSCFNKFCDLVKSIKEEKK